MDPQLENVVKACCSLIDVSINPCSSNAARIEANTKLNDLTKTEIHSNANLYVNVALVLISQKDENEGPFVHDYLKEIYVHYGFKVINELVKYNWYKFDQALKDRLKEACIEWCNSRLFARMGNTLFPSKISTSSLVLNTCSLAITEIFIREWPNNWPNFLGEITQTSSLVSVYSILNISDYMHTLLIPANPNRRKEIIKSLMQHKNTIYEYFHQCLSIQESQAFHDIKLTLEYRQLHMLKTLETLESLFEWFYLSEEIISRVMLLATNSPLNLDHPFYHKIKIRSYRCIQSIIKQTNPNRAEDMAIISELFHDCSPDHFLNYLVTNILGSYLRYRSPIEDNSQLYELFTLALDIGVDTICQVIALFNKDTTNASLRATIVQNQNLWLAFLNFVLECLRYNNASFDETLLKFLLVYSKLRREGVEDAKSISPIVSSIDQQIPLQILALIGHCKVEPKSQIEATKRELRASFQIDSYESYLSLFNLNRNKFLNVVHEFARHSPDVCQVYVSSVLQEMLGPVEMSASDCSWSPGIRSWNVVATLFAAILPKLSPPPSYIAMLEAYFERLLNAIKDSTKEEAVLSAILSTLSSMSPFYNNFPSRLIQELIERIFEFTLKHHNDQTRGTELQNHASSLFIKLTNNCSNILIPFFDLMRNHIDNLAQKNLISSLQFCALYEGLLILSNQFDEVEEQRSFILENLLPKISWIASYDFGPNGINFFRDIGLSEHPNLQSTEFPYFSHPKFTESFVALNLLSRLFKRANPNRLLAISGFSALSYLTPFYKFVGAMNAMWHFHQTNDHANLDQLCHPFYHKYLFAETPIFQLNAICIDRPFLVPKDQLKILMNNWDRKGPPSAELVGMHTHHRVAILYSQSMCLLSTSLNYLFYYYSTCPSAEGAIIEDFLKNAFHLMFANCKSLPLVYHFELIKLYLRNVVSYCPRNEKFLKSTEIVEILTDFLPFIFNKLDQKFQLLKQEKENSVANSAPSRGGSRYAIVNSKNREEHHLEICLDFATNSIAQEFINVLRDIFSEPKNIDTWASRFQLESQQQNSAKQTEDETMEDDMMCSSCPGDGGSSSNKDLAKFDSDLLLSNHMISFNPSPLVIIASNCLLWPLDNLRLVVSEVNSLLLKSLLARGQIQSVDGFYYLAERIIRAISLTEKSDAATVNSFVALFSLLYEKVIFANNLTGIVNPQLAQICSVEPQQWDQFAQSLSVTTASERKRQQKKLKSLLDNVYSKETSMLHAMTKPSVACLGATVSVETESAGDGRETDTFSLAWLL